MTWIINYKQTWLEWAVARILKVGPLPKHIALILDGNRRYAKKNNNEPIKGHIDGFKKLTELIAWCGNLGVNEITAYTFSIANFKRPRKEVDDLMNFAIEKFEELLSEVEELHKHEICVRVLGNISLLPKGIQKKIAKTILLTKDNKKAFLNLGIAYTSQEEISNSMKRIQEGVEKEYLLKTDINDSLLEQALYTRTSREPDLLIRTSGEVRLSDFLLWQSGFSCLFFSKVLWPEITIWHLFGALFYYQRHFHILQKEKAEALSLRERNEELSDLECCRYKYGEKMTQEMVAAYTMERKQRTNNFLANLDNNRFKELHDILN